MTRPTITADTTVKTSFRVPWPSISPGSSSSMLLAGQTELLEQSALILSHELDSRNTEDRGQQTLGRSIRTHFLRVQQSDAGESFQSRLANHMIRPNLIKLFTSDTVRVMWSGRKHSRGWQAQVSTLFLLIVQVLGMRQAHILSRGTPGPCGQHHIMF